MKRSIIIVLIALGICMTPAPSYSQGVDDYLIVNDIGIYKVSKLHEAFIGEPPIGGPRTEDGAGALRATHFNLDHADKTYEVLYWNEGDNVATPNVVVTQHAGGESDRWLLHELENKFRSDEEEIHFSGTVKEYTGNKVITYNFGGDYAWLSGNVLVYIAYEDAQLEKPEPIEVVKAYLQKFPSTLSISAEEIRSIEHGKQWIKDEMERRLWLCDKWDAAYVSNKAKKEDLLYAFNSNMEAFLEYRKKYYNRGYGDDLNTLWHYQYTTFDVEGMRRKLVEYKTWWASHKDDSFVMKMFRKLIP